VDALDGPAVAEVVLRHRPDVVVHQMTRLPRSLEGADAGFATANARLRTVGTANLVAAANAAGTKRLVAQSIAFAYAPVGPMIVAEDAPLFLDAPEPWATTVAGVAELERLVLDEFEGSGTVLRYGTLYGPGTWWAADGDLTAAVRAGTFPLVGTGVGVTSFLHVDDAAAAATQAVELGRPGVYNISDDEPAPSATWIPQVAAQLHAPPPRWLDEDDATRRLGWRAVHQRTEQRGAHNGAARADLDVVPSHPTWRRTLGLDPA
jgi:nucleoside-diphosphate-sugar epimerase